MADQEFRPLQNGSDVSGKTSPESEIDEPTFLEQNLSSNTDTSDFDFEAPDLGTDGWAGPWVWVQPPNNEAVFGPSMLKKINLYLPRIHTPTSIQNPIPVLGRASHGKLKADEWRHLFTVQLSLLLPVFWND
ncbi:hypothetical protein PPACK8108_LOCUS14657 [Phakopsora pachyrhizi]|uniref:Uncharacterized protein n=1 Tax=Phakopsora pachyrhizi TaxID=170000 RepID=A0AAV0B916_PHAPC|nr:hypothetical protein PPACK8108_LOCUS14657 [Phakopsora pachyrhizi]